MSGYVSIDDPAFDREVTLREAYLILEHFVSAHFQRGELGTGDLLSYFALTADRRGGDPAALYDFLDSVAAVLPSRTAGEA
jgi:hypothetical protein